MYDLDPGFVDDFLLILWSSNSIVFNTACLIHLCIAKGRHGKP